jgi:hypothetical protein
VGRNGFFESTRGRESGTKRGGRERERGRKGRRERGKGVDRVKERKG